MQGRLVENGKLIGSFEIGNNSIHGGFTACGTLSSLGENIASDIANWLKSPTIDPGVSGTSITIGSGGQEMPSAGVRPAAVPTAIVPLDSGSPVKAALASGQRVTLSATRVLRRQPKDTAPLGDRLAPGTTVTLDGRIGDFWFVKSGSVAGWLRVDELP